jgi:hypothetical protein
MLRAEPMILDPTLELPDECRDAHALFFADSHCARRSFGCDGTRRFSYSA